MTIHRSITSPGCGCDGQDMLHPLISIDEALARMFACVAPVGRTQAVALDSALGRVLSDPVRAFSMVPAFDNAAMDGYAVASTSFDGDGPWEFPVVARVPAGEAATSPISGRVAARIFTGAPVPEGADAVVMQEDVIRDGGIIRLRRRPAPGLNIRRAGSDMAERAIVLDKGCRLGPREIAACAAAGAGIVRVRRRLHVALVVTGDEVRRAGTPRAAAQIWDVNTPMLTAALATAGVEIVSIAHGGDSPADLVRKIGDMAALADLVVTTGGISVGEEDHVKPVFSALGGETIFSGVALKPGKPVSFGRIGSTFWLGLPGNPLSAFVTWQVFGMALIRGLSGETAQSPSRRHVVTSAAIRRKSGRCELRLATLAGFDAHGREIVTFEDATHSGRVGGLSLADGLMFLPADAGYLPAGALVEFQPFQDGAGATFPSS
ncbi:molybdopterin molybdotransferase MoeA [Oceanibium sediminis]|uniref:molybdopterin molybdotransferase MoeA n=1 Tax=Oceanibium sediminis TaxID=2026339 RepID=UPI000DD36F60|nr:gephyrin-like molybdotransferase Glp [Oceanibium sediminis]